MQGSVRVRAADLPGGAMTGGRSSPGIDPAAAAAPVAGAVPAPGVGSVLSLWEGEARMEPACDAPPSRASRGRLAGVRGPGNLHLHIINGQFLVTLSAETVMVSNGWASGAQRACILTLKIL